MIESILNSTFLTTTNELSFSSAVVYALFSALFGVIISFTYMKTGKTSKNFARTLVILPVLVCVVMLAVNGNFGASVAVLGAFSLVRFRSLQGTSRDIAFVFFAMTIGIICSIGNIAFAAVVLLIVCSIYYIMNLTNYAQKKDINKDLRITIPEHLDYAGIFEDIFEMYTNKSDLIQVKTTNMGSMYELRYKVLLKDETLEKEFIDKIRTRNGNLTVICGYCDANPMEEL